MRVIFDFVGGPRDGERIVGECEDDATTEAACLYRRTVSAGVGQRFWCPCEYTVAALRTIPFDTIECLERVGYRFRGHVYEITSRRQLADAVVARVRHRFAAE